MIIKFTNLDNDRSNFALLCWQDLTGYEEIKKNAVELRTKAKAIKDKQKDGGYKIKYLR